MARPKKDDTQRRLISTRIDPELYDEAHAFAIMNKDRFHGVYEIIEEGLKDYLIKLKGEA